MFHKSFSLLDFVAQFTSKKCKFSRMLERIIFAVAIHNSATYQFGHIRNNELIKVCNLYMADLLRGCIVNERRSLVLLKLSIETN